MRMEDRQLVLRQIRPDVPGAIAGGGIFPRDTVLSGGVL